MRGQTNKADKPWMRFRCPVCERRRPKWAGIYAHCQTVHGVAPLYANALVFDGPALRPDNQPQGGHHGDRQV